MRIIQLMVDKRWRAGLHYNGRRPKKELVSAKPHVVPVLLLLLRRLLTLERSTPLHCLRTASRGHHRSRLSRETFENLIACYISSTWDHDGNKRHIGSKIGHIAASAAKGNNKICMRIHVT